jgi:hypothetical protein
MFIYKAVNLYKGKPNQLIDKLKIKNYFGGDSTKGEKINLYMSKGMKQIYFCLQSYLSQ